MKDKNSYKWQLPISCVFIVLTVCIYVFLLYFIKIQPILWLFGLLMIPIITTLSAFFHEFGHFITAKRLGFTVYYFKFGVFVYDKFAKKKFKISFSRDILGEIRFFPKRAGDYSKMNEKVLLGGLFGGLTLAVLLNVILILSLFGVFGQVSSRYFILFFGFSPYSLYAFLVNCIPWFHPLNDGSRLKLLKNENERLAIDNYYTVLKSLNEGKTYSEIPREHFLVDPSVSDELKSALLLFDLKRALQINDQPTVDGATVVLELEEFPVVDICCELSYRYALDGNQEMAETYYQLALEMGLDDDNPNHLKAMLVHAKTVGDEEYFKVAKPTLLKLCQKGEFCKGDLIYIEQSLNRL